jgi:hypothetical protein
MEAGMEEEDWVAAGMEEVGLAVGLEVAVTEVVGWVVEGEEEADWVVVVTVLTVGAGLEGARVVVVAECVTHLQQA